MILKSHSYSHVGCWKKGKISRQAWVWNDGAFFPRIRCYSTDSNYVIFRLFKDNGFYSLSWSTEI